MGKRRGFLVHKEHGESKTQDERKLAQKITDKTSDLYKGKIAQIRATQYPRWREICEVGPDDPIDMDNPYVHLEWFLCDFEWQVKLMNGRRDYVLQQMDEQQR